MIHPFIDGNGRTARILMNLILMRSGYPIALITREDRLRYYDALEEAQGGSDLTPFIALLIECIEETLEEYEDAEKQQREQKEWATSLASQFTQPEHIQANNEYEVWHSAMDLLIHQYENIVGLLDESADLAKIYIKTFGMLEFEKYLALRQRQSAKRTWFFRVDFVRGDTTVRYLHFFRYANHPMSEHTKISLMLAREVAPFHYELLDDIRGSKVPKLREIGYSLKKEQFVSRYNLKQCRSMKIEKIVQDFFEDVMKQDFQV